MKLEYMNLSRNFKPRVKSDRVFLYSYLIMDYVNEI